MESCPKWLADECAAEVTKLLRGFIAHYSAKGVIPKKKVTRGLLPSLFSFAQEESRTYVLELLSHLQQESILLLTEKNGDLTYIQ